MDDTRAPDVHFEPVDGTAVSPGAASGRVPDAAVCPEGDAKGGADGPQPQGAAEAPAAAPAEPDFEFDDHFFSMRRKLLKEGAAVEEYDDAEPGRFMAAIEEEETNLNFDDEEVCGALEDPALVSHMEKARLRYNEELAQLSRTGTAETARLAVTKALGEAAEALAGLKKLTEEFETPVDEISILGRRFESVILRRSPMYPHYPKVPAAETCADPVLREMAASLKTKLNNRAKILDAHTAGLKAQYAQWTRARSLMLQARDGLVNLCETQAEVIRQQKDIIAGFAKMVERS